MSQENVEVVRSANALFRAGDLETLIEGVQQAERVYGEAQQWSGQLVAELKRRGLSWPVLARRYAVCYGMSEAT